jgi:hypothetical protein
MPDAECSKVSGDNFLLASSVYKQGLLQFIFHPEEELI